MRRRGLGAGSWLGEGLDGMRGAGAEHNRLGRVRRAWGWGYRSSGSRWRRSGAVSRPAPAGARKCSDKSPLC